jgi:O-antigen ligase
MAVRSTRTFAATWAMPVALVALAALAGSAATLLGYRTNPVLPLAALGVVALAAIRPMVTLHLAVLLIPLELVTADVGGAALSATEGAATLAGLGWAARRLIAGERLFAPSPLNAALGLLLLASVIGLAVGQEPDIAVKRLLIGTSLFFIIQMLAFEANQRTARTMLLALVVAGAIVAAVAAIGAAGERPELVGFGGVAKNRAVGSFEEPNLLASFLAFALPAALALAFGTPAFFRPAPLAAFGVILFAIILSLSRGGLLAAAAGMLVMLGWPPVRRAALLVTMVILSFGALSADPVPGSEYVQLVTKRMESVRFTGAATGDFRGQLWATTPQIIRDNLLVGIGPGNFPDVSPRYGILDPNQGDAVEHAHSVPLTLAVETGVAGIIALVLLALRLPPMLVEACRRNVGWQRGMAFAVAAGLTAFAVQGVIDYTLWSNIIAFLVAVFLGLATALRQRAMEVEGPPPAAAVARRGPRGAGRPSPAGPTAGGKRGWPPDDGGRTTAPPS